MTSIVLDPSVQWFWNALPYIAATVAVFVAVRLMWGVQKATQPLDVLQNIDADIFWKLLSSVDILKDEEIFGPHTSESSSPPDFLKFVLALGPCEISEYIHDADETTIQRHWTAQSGNEACQRLKTLGDSLSQSDSSALAFINKKRVQDGLPLKTLTRLWDKNKQKMAQTLVWGGGYHYCAIVREFENVCKEI